MHYCDLDKDLSCEVVQFPRSIAILVVTTHNVDVVDGCHSLTLYGVLRRLPDELTVGSHRARPLTVWYGESWAVLILWSYSVEWPSSLDKAASSVQLGTAA